MRPAPRPKPVGVLWVVFKTLKVPVRDKDGRRKRLFGGRAALTIERTQRVGEVWAPDRAQALVLAQAYYGERCEVQSAASAALTDEAESVVRTQRIPVTAEYARRSAGKGTRPPAVPAWIRDGRSTGKARLARFRKRATP